MQLLGSSWIAGLLEETRLRLPKEGMHRIEGRRAAVYGIAFAQRPKLTTGLFPCQGGQLYGYQGTRHSAFRVQ